MINGDVSLEVDVARQELYLWLAGALACVYPVSTARNGTGQEQGSFRTPLGWHKIRAKIGAGAPPGAVFRGRRPTGEIYSADLAALHPERDWILSRILWLDGCEPGYNRYGKVDTGQRYIYIHGAPDETVNGTAQSHGCVRMRNADVIDLYQRAPLGTRVLIR